MGKKRVKKEYKLIIFTIKNQRENTLLETLLLNKIYILPGFGYVRPRLLFIFLFLFFFRQIERFPDRRVSPVISAVHR